MSTLTINEGFNPNTGVQTRTHFDGDEAIVIQKTFDAEPYLREAELARQASEGQRWGEGRIVGTIPPAFHAKILTVRDPQERKRMVREFFKQNPQFVKFDPYLKNLRTA
jgi:hypothetical protein